MLLFSSSLLHVKTRALPVTSKKARNLKRREKATPFSANETPMVEILKGELT
jgi:hypothetical protein